MSQTDLYDVSMQEEKSSSVCEFITSARSIQRNPKPSNASLLPPLPSTNLFKTFVSTPSIDE